MELGSLCESVRFLKGDFFGEIDATIASRQNETQFVPFLLSFSVSL